MYLGIIQIYFLQCCFALLLGVENGNCTKLFNNNENSWNWILNLKIWLIIHQFNHLHGIINNWAKHCPVGETMYKNSYKFRVEMMSITHKRKTIVPTEGNRKVFVICFDRWHLTTPEIRKANRMYKKYFWKEEHELHGDTELLRWSFLVQAATIDWVFYKQRKFISQFWMLEI